MCFDCLQHLFAALAFFCFFSLHSPWEHREHDVEGATAYKPFHCGTCKDFCTARVVAMTKGVFAVAFTLQICSG